MNIAFILTFLGVTFQKNCVNSLQITVICILILVYCIIRLENRINKSTQRVHNTFEKRSSTFPLPPFSPPPLSLAQHTFLFIRKKERILSCLVASCIGVYSLPVHPILSPFPFFTSLLLSVRFLCAIRIWREFLTASVRPAFHVNVATNVTKRHM